jgi:hypothetical protein
MSRVLLRKFAFLDEFDLLQNIADPPRRRFGSAATPDLIGGDTAIEYS